MGLIKLFVLSLINIGVLCQDQLVPSFNTIPVISENGFALIKSKQIPIVENYTKIVHVINITELEENLILIQENIIKLNMSEQDTLFDPIVNEIKQAKHNINLFQNKKKRSKRGLLNIVGKLNKYLIGTMDSEDSEEIYSHLQNLDENLKQITGAENSQLIINKNIVKNLESVRDQLNANQQNITKYFYNVSNTLVLDEIKFENMFKTFVLLQQLNKHLEQIKDIILASQINILPHDILTETEIEKYDITMEVLPYLKSNVIIYKSLIAICLSIPKFSSKKFFENILIPFPNSNNEELNTPIFRMLVWEKEIYEQPITITKEKNLIEIKNNCIKNIFKSNSNCTYIRNKEKSIEQIENGLIILRNFDQNFISHNCYNKTFIEENVNKNLIIKFHFCKVKIENVNYVNEDNLYFETNLIPQINFKDRKIMNLTLENIHIETIENREQINYINFKQNTNFGLSTFIIIFIVIIVIIIVYKKYCTSEKTVNKIVIRNQPYVDPFK